ncbi:MAG: arsenate reductase ArsC [Halioglobus sp.]
MKNVLVLCTGNSCRSIMAEALINHFAGEHFRAVSAGSFPAGYVHPGSLETLRRHHIPVEQPRSKSWDEFLDANFDLVITVCDEAAAEVCPIVDGSYKRLHWSTPDPARAAGGEGVIRDAFETVYCQLRGRIESELMKVVGS